MFKGRSSEEEHVPAACYGNGCGKPGPGPRAICLESLCHGPLACLLKYWGKNFIGNQ